MDWSVLKQIGVYWAIQREQTSERNLFNWCFSFSDTNQHKRSSIFLGIQ